MSVQSRTRGGFGADGRGQAHTIEVALAALIVVSAIGAAMQVTPPTAVPASSAAVDDDPLYRTSAVDLLETGAATGALLETVLYWDPVAGTFASTAADHPSGDATRLPTAFGRTLERTLVRRGLGFTLSVVYHTENAAGRPTVVRQPIVESGVPHASAVAASRVVTIPKNASLTAPGVEDRRLDALDASSGERFYVPPSDDGAVYAAVEVELVVWRS